MNVLLTDYLSCPRCGPAFGLILLAQDVVDRRVRSGELGCPNCRDRFQVEGGFTDLRAPPRLPLPLEASPESAGDPAPHAMKIAAALGVAEGPGFFVFMGVACGWAGAVASLVKDMEVVTVGGAPGPPVAKGVSPIAAAGQLPFRGGARGVVLEAEQWEAWGAEGVRIAATSARVVVTGAPSEETRLPSDPALTLLLSDGGFGVFRKD